MAAHVIFFIFEVISGSVQSKMLTHRDTLVNSAFSALIIEDKDAPAHESEGKHDQRHKGNKKLIYNRSNTLRQFDLFCSIHSKLAKRKTLWDEAGINRLRDEISDFSFLYISLNGVAKVSIYLHLLFNGTILDHFRRHKNIAVYDNQRWEYEHNFFKETLYNQTSMSHGIAHDLYVHNAVKLPFIVENNMKAQEFPD